jgi:catechol 2,3-dioxygenase-like lactoylglutathione lyase family enzyme
MKSGVHHVGLVTLNIDRTIEFYTKKLGWEIGWCDIIEEPGGGKIKHVFFDTGDGTLIAFMSPEKFPGVPAEFSTDINAAQNLPNAFYHHAFRCDSVEELERKREELVGKGIDVTVVMDHEWCKSIYFRDPNGLQLEYCATVRPFNAGDKIMRHHEQPGPMAKNPKDAEHMRRMLFGSGDPK